MRTGIRTTRKWTRTTRERNNEESKFLTVCDVRNTRRRINTIFTDGPGLYKFPSNIHLKVEIHAQLTNTRLNVLLLLNSSIPKGKCENTICNSIGSYRQTGPGHSEINISLTKTNIKVVLISWNKFVWIIYILSFPTSQNATRLHCKQQLVIYEGNSISKLKIVI